MLAASAVACGPQRIATGVDASNFMLVPGGVVWSTNERPIDPSMPEGLQGHMGELRLGEDPDASILLDRNAQLAAGLTIDSDAFYATFDAGRAEIEGIRKAGACQVSFPEFDNGAWTYVSAHPL